MVRIYFLFGSQLMNWTWTQQKQKLFRK